MSKKTVSELWDEIFKDYEVLNHIKCEGYFDIQANQIKDYKEPRLMTKFDSESSLPKVFKNNNLGILPIDNGIYRIGKFELYQVLPKNEIEVEEVELQDYFETIDPDNVYSEANALHIALLSGMFDIMLNDKMKQTVSGRMRINEFEFDIKKNNSQDVIHIEVKKPQIEIDGGYEGENNILLVEAKNEMYDSFIIRQLYFPYRYWKGKVTKSISTFFFVYENGIYHIFNYEFKKEDYYNSLELKSQKSFVVKYTDTYNTIKKLLDETEIRLNDTNQKIPFPQANAMGRVFKTVNCLRDGSKTAKEISEILEMTDRQGSYYGDACRYLRFATKNGTKYEITRLGKMISLANTKNRNKMVTKAMITHRVFNDALRYAINKKEKIISTNECEEIMRKYDIFDKDKMYKRRASTVKGWINWVLNSNM